MRLYIRRVTEALKVTNQDQNHTLPVSDDLKDELLTWVQAKYITTKRSWLKKGLKPVEFKIFTDASSGAAGVEFKGKGITETVYWDPEDPLSQQPIMIKEAYAVHYVVKNYGHLLKNSRVLFKQDNKAVETCFLHGSRKSPELTKWIRMIHEEANKYNIAMDMEWVSTTEQEADEASRKIDTKEAVIKNQAFLNLNKALGKECTLDAFANPANAKCEKFWSLRDTAGAAGVDFFTQEDFGSEVLWVFPPKPMEDFAFQLLQERGKNNFWIFCLEEHETASPIWPEVLNNAYFRILDPETNNPVLFPAKVRSEEFGFWREPSHVSFSFIGHHPENIDLCSEWTGNKTSSKRAAGAPTQTSRTKRMR
ncbi:Oidioi.mRNA.OKI2018_I69.YSR.g17076.t1.cds [Oikopleura dioica]|uniref:Oidioi.mRNA.OKI2018_I69.YSR.g17076.t1.cds n=1 Tax=Oikopleura dioica TaxID=34765 RepID=A0ABN7SLV6_OIKDI|nr:Oidioi.mRNA.OKI2018_I69.YSR.g17076.t1.cds [Oikopleura dioica]